MGAFLVLKLRPFCNEKKSLNLILNLLTGWQSDVHHLWMGIHRHWRHGVGSDPQAGCFSKEHHPPADRVGVRSALGQGRVQRGERLRWVGQRSNAVCWWVDVTLTLWHDVGNLYFETNFSLIEIVQLILLVSTWLAAKTLNAVAPWALVTVEVGKDFFLLHLRCHCQHCCQQQHEWRHFWSALVC